MRLSKEGQTIKARYETVDNLALFAEPHLSQNLHLHGLIKFEGGGGVLNHVRESLGGFLTDRFGYSRVEFPRGAGAVSKYVAKYCVKTDGYYEIW